MTATSSTNKQKATLNKTDSKRNTGHELFFVFFIIYIKNNKQFTDLSLIRT